MRLPIIVCGEPEGPGGSDEGRFASLPATWLRLPHLEFVARLLGGCSRNDAARNRAQALKTFGIGAFVRHAHRDDSEGFVDVRKSVGVLRNAGR